MSFRTRLILISAAAVALAVVVASAILYVVVRGQLRDQVDAALRERAAEAVIERAPTGGIAVQIPLPPLGTRPFFQLVSDRGVLPPPPADEKIALPVTDRTRAVAEGRAGEFFEDARVAGAHVRIYTHRIGPHVAIQLARRLDEVDGTLKRLRLILVLVSLGGVAVASGLGLAVARAALAPVRRLTDASEHVTETQDLSSRIAASGSDELSRLAASFNRMLGALEDAVRSQQRLVADASHELRTPVTSVRLNAELLARDDQLPADERKRVLGDLVRQSEELTSLVSDLLDLARGTESPPALEDLWLDEIVADAVERAQRNAPGVRFQLAAEPCVVHGDRDRLGRAVANLLDNAAKWSPAGDRIEVRVADGKVSVRDHGPGIHEAHLPFVFERFYRAPAARELPGSGLGLAIVRQVAEEHGGRVRAEPAAGGGAQLVLELLPSS